MASTGVPVICIPSIKLTLEDGNKAKVLVRGRVDVVLPPVGVVDAVAGALAQDLSRQRSEEHQERPERDRHDDLFRFLL